MSFAGNTLIETDKGTFTIQQIVEGKIKATVKCMNLTTGIVLNESITSYMITPVSQISTVIFSNNIAIDLTPDHLIVLSDLNYTAIEDIDYGAKCFSNNSEQEIIVIRDIYNQNNIDNYGYNIGVGTMNNIFVSNLLFAS